MAHKATCASPFDEPVYTADVVGMGTLRLLEAIRNVGGIQTIRFYQASSSEIYGQVHELPQTETTPLPSAQPLCLRQGLCLLADAELS